MVWISLMFGLVGETWKAGLAGIRKAPERVVDHVFQLCVLTHRRQSEGTGIAALINCRRRAGDTGCSVTCTRSGARAFSMAELIQAAAGVLPPPPAPWAPSGVSGDRAWTLLISLRVPSRAGGEP